MEDAGPQLFKGSGWEDVIERLTQLARPQELVQRAMEGHAGWWKHEDELELPFTFADVRAEFRSHSLTFKSSLLSYPYVNTTLALYVGKREVGEYRLITTLDGEADDDYFVIYEQYQEGGRAVDLLRE